MIVIKDLLKKFDVNLDLPDHILNLEFFGDYTKHIIFDEDPFYPDEIFHQFIDEDKGYVISLSSRRKRKIIRIFGWLLS